MKKNRSILALLILVIGLLVGWLLKPAGPAAEPSAEPVVKTSAAPAAKAESTAAAEPAVPGKRAVREPAVREPANPYQGMSDEQVAQVKNMQGEMSKMMVARQRAKFEKQIERWAGKIKLTENQKADLTSWLDGEMKKLEELDLTNVNSMSGFKGLPTEKSLEEQLAPSLTAEQSTALAAFKEHEHQSKVDSMALKNLSLLQGVIDFEEGQRDEVFNILAEDADENLRSEQEKPDITKELTEGMGIDMDPYNLGIQQALTESVMSPGSPAPAGNPAEIAKKMREVIDQRIESKIEKLRPVLNDRQLEQYRTELKTKGLGIYGTVLMGMEGGAPQQ
jgi:hypothetical protein